MELISAIALLCQLNIGFGGGSDEYSGNIAKNITEVVNVNQKICQQKLSMCILDMDKSSQAFRTSTVLECINKL